MKKNYNKLTTVDVPMDVSFTSPEQTTKSKTTKAKINKIGKPKQTKKTEQVDKNLRTKLVGSEIDIDDLDKLNEENVRSYRFKSKRNKVIIVILSVFLALSIAGIAIYLAISKLQTNCNLIAKGVEATFYVDGDKLSEFRAPSNLRGNSILNFKLEIEIEEGGEYKVVFYPRCYQKGVLMENTLIYEHNTDLFSYDEEYDVYRSRQNISGNQRFMLCGGLILDKQYEQTLTVDNFKLEFYVEFERV